MRQDPITPSCHLAGAGAWAWRKTRHGMMIFIIYIVTKNVLMPVLGLTLARPLRLLHMSEGVVSQVSPDL